MELLERNGLENKAGHGWVKGSSPSQVFIQDYSGVKHGEIRTSTGSMPPPSSLNSQFDRFLASQSSSGPAKMLARLEHPTHNVQHGNQMFAVSGGPWRHGNSPLHPKQHQDWVRCQIITGFIPFLMFYHVLSIYSWPNFPRVLSFTFHFRPKNQQSRSHMQLYD